MCFSLLLTDLLFRELGNLSLGGRAVKICEALTLIRLFFVSFNLSKVWLKIFNLCLESIPLQFHEHFFFDCIFIFCCEHFKLLLIGLLLLLEFANIIVKLTLLLLNSSMVNLLEVSLLSQFIICWPWLLSDVSGFIDLRLKWRKDIWQLYIIFV